MGEPRVKTASHGRVVETISAGAFSGALAPRLQLDKALLQHPQVQAQVVKLLHVAQRNIHVSHLVLDVFQSREFLVELRRRKAAHHSLVDFPQVGIPAIDLAPGSPAQ